MVGSRVTCHGCPWRRDGEIRGEQRDRGAASSCFLCEGDAHPPRGAVTEETDSVEGLTGTACADEHATACERIGLSEQLAAAPEDLRGLRQPADAPFTFGGVPFLGADEQRAAGPKGLDVRLGCRVFPHARIHRRGEQHRTAVSEGCLGDVIVRKPVCDLGQGVCGERRNHEQIGPRQMDVEILRG